MEKTALGKSQAYVILVALIFSLLVVPAYASALETLCDGLDDDGDTLIDEDFTYQGASVGEACNGIGECGWGVVECVGLYSADCDTNPGRTYDESETEVCNGLDDDCDGIPDEDFTYQGASVGEACNGIGECGWGAVECTSPSTADCDTNPGRTYDESEPEVCNGLDDDCDGTNDDGGNALCDNGQWCDGEETCEGGAGCVSGSAPDCADSVGCTTDSCNEGTDSCTHTPNDAYCDNGLWCDGEETCDTYAGCISGAQVDCSGNNIAQIATCTWNPDGLPFTWDYFAGFTSTCSEATDSCTTGSVTLSHTCSISSCGAECEDNNDCDDNSCSQTYSDYCSGSRLVEYDTDKVKDSTTVSDSCSNTCGSDCGCTDCSVDCSAPSTHTYCVQGVCGAACDSASDCQPYCSGDTYYSSGDCTSGCECSYSSTDCNSQDGWYDTGSTQWVSTGQCTQKQQKEQDYRDYTCGGSGCEYSVTDSRWVDTGTTGNKADGTTCDDGQYCTVSDECNSGVCGGSARSCADSVACSVDSCNEATDSCTHTANDAYCDNGQWCDGEETCSVTAGCQSGTAPSCADSFGCTTDSCNEATDSCNHAPSDAYCDDGKWCNGDETCSVSQGCQPGTVVDCSANDIAAIGACFYDPDGNPFTWDFFAGFTSVCNEDADSCTVGTFEVQHECNTDTCGAECETDSDCVDGYCLDDCGCRLYGDANKDDKVNIFDLAKIGKAFNSIDCALCPDNQTTCAECERWDPDADVGKNTGNPQPGVPDGKIDIGDLIVIGMFYGNEK